MQPIVKEDFLIFARDHKYVFIGQHKIPIGNKWNITKYGPENYTCEKDTVWSFPERGNWATHVGDYRGNWSPYIPRNLLLKYTRKGDIVLDQMVGSGTTLVECKLLGRNAIGVDINLNALIITQDRLDFKYEPLIGDYKEPEIRTYLGDARNLDKISDNSIDLIATHPPYAHIISYSEPQVEGDLSALPFEDYLKQMSIVAKEAYRVLKPRKYCAILIGDTRKHKHYIPIAYRVMQAFLDAGFILKEDIIKLQWNTKTTREKWNKKSYDFYLIVHEHLYIFRKPSNTGELKEFKLSIKWW
ncbi:MAG: DNA methyltransferase [Thermoproteota archaeon]